MYEVWQKYLNLRYKIILQHLLIMYLISVEGVSFWSHALYPALLPLMQSFQVREQPPRSILLDFIDVLKYYSLQVWFLERWKIQNARCLGNSVLSHMENVGLGQELLHKHGHWSKLSGLMRRSSPTHFPSNQCHKQFKRVRTL